MPTITRTKMKQGGLRDLVTPDVDSLARVLADLHTAASMPVDTVGAHGDVLRHFATRLAALGPQALPGAMPTGDEFRALQADVIARCPGCVPASFQFTGHNPVRELPPVEGLGTIERSRERSGPTMFAILLRSRAGEVEVGRGITPAMAVDDLVARWPMR